MTHARTARALLGLLIIGALLAGCVPPAMVGTPDAPARGPQGRAALAPSTQDPKLDLAAPLDRIIFASCLQQGRAAPILESMIKEKSQLLLMMGDNVYGDVSTGELNELYAAYAGLNARRDWGRLRSAQPILATWDDHDYGLNDAGAEFPHKALSQKLFADFWNLPQTSPARSREGIYDSQIAGVPRRRVQIIMLDTRTFRSSLKPTDKRDEPGKERYLADNDPAKTILGAEHWAWLEGELKKPADLRLIVTSIQLIADGHGWERWGLLPAERARFYDLIKRSHAKGVILLSGDRHRAAIYRETKATRYPLYELTSSSLNLAFPNSKNEDLPTPTRIGPMYIQENYGVLSIDWDGRAVLAEIKDQKGVTQLKQTIPFSEIGVR